MKSTADEGDTESQLMQRPTQRPSTWSQANPLAHLVECLNRDSLEQRDALSQRLREVDFASHRSGGDICHGVLAVSVRGDQFDDFILDQSRIDIHHNEAGATARQAWLLHG